MGVRVYIGRHPAVLYVWVRAVDCAGAHPKTKHKKSPAGVVNGDRTLQGPGMLSMAPLNLVVSLQTGCALFLQRTRNYRRPTASFANNAAGLVPRVLNAVSAFCSVGAANVCILASHVQTQFSRAVYLAQSQHQHRYSTR